MRLFTRLNKAMESESKKKKVWMNSRCPFNDRICGSWCALFFMGKNTPEGNSYVMLGCKGSDKHLYIDEIIED